MKTKRYSGRAAVCALALAVTGCANVPSSPETLARFSGSYDVVAQSGPKAFEFTQIDLRFNRDSNGIASANVRLTNGETSVDYVYLNCGYPGDRIANNFSASEKPGDSEVIRCQQSVPRGPVLFMARAVDGRPLKFAGYSGGVISAMLAKTVVSETGWKIGLNWGPDTHSGYAVRRRPESSADTTGALRTAE